MDLSKQNASTVFSRSVKWLISSSWITLACRYMYEYFYIHFFFSKYNYLDTLPSVFDTLGQASGTAFGLSLKSIYLGLHWCYSRPLRAFTCFKDFAAY